MESKKNLKMPLLSGVVGQQMCEKVFVKNVQMGHYLF